MKSTNQQTLGSKKRPIQPEYEEEEIQPTIQQSAFMKRPKLIEPIEENKEEFYHTSESEDEDNMSP